MTTETKPTTALAVVRPTEHAMASPARGVQINTMADLERFCGAAVKSGFFKDARDMAQALIKVQYGMEIGIPPVAAMNGIHVIEGKMAVSAGLIASKIQSSGRYNYRVKRLDDEACEIEFTENGKVIGLSTFTAKDAAAAELSGKAMWKKYRRNMLFSRAISNAQKWYAPGLFGGSVYTPEEIASSDTPISVTMGDAAQVEPPMTPETKALIAAELKRLQIEKGQRTFIESLNDGAAIENEIEAQAVLEKLKKTPDRTPAPAAAPEA